MKDRVVIVTGAASGIGRASAERLARDGARLMLADRDDCGALAKELAGGGAQAEAFALDVADEGQVAAMTARTLQAFGRIDGLVTAAGVNRRAQIPDTTEEDWRHIVETNLKGTWLCCRAAIPAMREAGGGAIVTIASELAVGAAPLVGLYAASKGGVVSMTRVMAIDHGPDRIRVNCICPGPVDTALLRRGIAAAPDPAKRRQGAIDSTILKRLGEPHEIANVVRFLLSDEASFMTGSIVMADGGATAQ